MTHGDPPLPLPGSAGRSATFSESPTGRPGRDEPPQPVGTGNAEMHRQWRMFGNAATAVAVLTAPAVFLALTRVLNWRTGAAIVVTVLLVVAFRGLMDLVTRRFIPRPSLWGDDGAQRAADIADRRRVWFWRFWYRLALWLVGFFLVAVAVILLVQILRGDVDVPGAFLAIPRLVRDQFSAPGSASNWIGLAVSIPIIFAVNTLIFLGPLAYAGIRQIKVYEPGDVDWGARLDDVRGQEGAREAISRIVTLWQSSEAFEAAGGKPERGILFNGPPGTGKTLLARALATHFNAPFVMAPGPAFAQSFIGVDVMLVMWLMWRARRLSRKWGGQCVVFIDEIDAIGGRRSSLVATCRPPTIHDVMFHGPLGAITGSGDLVIETPEWRDRLFAARGRRESRPPTIAARLGERVREFVFPGMGGGGGAQGGLQQLLVEMDGVRAPGGLAKFVVNRINTFLDALYVVPLRIGPVPLRLRPARPRREEVYFIGACNVVMDALDPALVRPGRFGRQIPFHSPDVEDRRDIIDLYLDRVAHEPDLDEDARRDEFARITAGHSPAMIEQVCSAALTRAHFDGRAAASWEDVVDSITVIETGIDRGIEYVASEAKAIAIHEAGHAVTGHVFMTEHASTRLTIRFRGDSLGHHHMGQTVRRYGKFQHEEFADLVWTLGAMAAEHVFYGENTDGVAGDISSATASAALMVGAKGMAPERPSVPSVANPVEREIAERKLMRRFEQVGTRIMNRARAGGALTGDPVGATMDDRDKRAMVAQFLGQAFMSAYWFVRHNKTGTERVADILVERKEMYGDEVVRLLDSVNLTIPDIDPLDEDNWPRL